MKDIATIDKSMLPFLLQDYYKYNYDGQIADHNHIVNWYVHIISNGLASYENNQQTKSYYNYSAWSGLSKSQAYKSKNRDERDHISVVYYANLRTESCKK